MPLHIEAYLGVKFEIDDQKMHFLMGHGPITNTGERSMYNITCMYIDMSSEHLELRNIYCGMYQFSYQELTV